MPVTTQLRVVVGDRYNGVLRGDVVTIKGRSGTVAAWRELSTNMELTLENGDETWTRRVPLDSEINVLRTVPTDEEKLDNDLRRFSFKAHKKWEESKRGVEHSVAILNQKFLDGRAKGYLYPFDFDQAAEVVVYQERLALWESVMSRVESPKDVRGLVMAVMAVREHVTNLLTQRYNRSLSRSSSVISNLTEDIRRDAAAEWLDDTKYLDVEDLWERVSKEEK